MDKETKQICNLISNTLLLEKLRPLKFILIVKFNDHIKFLGKDKSQIPFYRELSKSRSSEPRLGWFQKTGLLYLRDYIGQLEYMESKGRDQSMSRKGNNGQTRKEKAVALSKVKTQDETEAGKKQQYSRIR